MGIGLSLLVAFLVLLATTCNWWSSSLGLVCPGSQNHRAEVGGPGPRKGALSLVGGIWPAQRSQKMSERGRVLEVRTFQWAMNGQGWLGQEVG